jgi:hypothetical protein
MNEEISLTSLANLKEVDFYDIVKYAVIQVVRVSIEDVLKYSLAVETIESLLIDNLDDGYFQRINEKWKELEEKYGTKKETELMRLKEFSQFKFRELVKLMKKRIPTEIEGVL